MKGVGCSDLPSHSEVDAFLVFHCFDLHPYSRWSCKYQPLTRSVVIVGLMGSGVKISQSICIWGGISQFLLQVLRAKMGLMMPINTRIPDAKSCVFDLIICCCRKRERELVWEIRRIRPDSLSKFVSTLIGYSGRTSEHNINPSAFSPFHMPVCLSAHILIFPLRFVNT